MGLCAGFPRLHTLTKIEESLVSEVKLVEKLQTDVAGM